MKHKHFDINLKSVILYSLVIIVLLLFSAFSEESFLLLVIWTVVFAFVDLGFAAYQPAVYRLFDIRKIKLLPLLSMVVICISSGFTVYYFMGELELLLFGESEDTLFVFSHLDHPLLNAIILIAVFPALFEELAFRGFIFNNFQFLGGKKAAIWGSSFLFALVHFSLLSLIWILPFGLLLSYFRNKYNTLLYGILGHFIHNATTLLIEHYHLL